MRHEEETIPTALSSAGHLPTAALLLSPALGDKSGRALLLFNRRTRHCAGFQGNTHATRQTIWSIKTTLIWRRRAGGSRANYSIWYLGRTWVTTYFNPSGAKMRIKSRHNGPVGGCFVPWFVILLWKGGRLCLVFCADFLCAGSEDPLVQRVGRLLRSTV